MYPPEAPYIVYCIDCWWSDGWNPEDYAREYDFTRPFFEQFDELLHHVPMRGLAISKQAAEGSPYTNHCDHAKNCYLIFYSDHNEDAQHGFYLANDKSLLDSSVLWECEQCYDSMNGFQNYRVHGSRGNVHNSLDCYFIRDAKNAQNCFGSSNLRNRKYVFFNEQLTKEEYEERIGEIDLGSYATYIEMKARAEEEWKKTVPLPVYDYMSTENCTGSYIFYSKNCTECYDSGYCEDCKYVMLIKANTKDSYDYTDWGANAERVYEGITVGNGVSNVRFAQDVHTGHDIDYAKSCMNSSYLFGCSGMRGKDYYILNKKYTKEEFYTMREKIITHMQGVPYEDTMGREYRYGEFFPMALSPHDYNDTFARMFSPKNKDTAQKEGLSWMESPLSEYETTKLAKDLPDHIRDATEEVLEEIIGCETCSRGYRVTALELQFLKQHNFPLPRRCPFCRIEEKIAQWVKQMRLIERICDKCSATLQTPYDENDAPKIFCKDCYFKEIM